MTRFAANEKAGVSREENRAGDNAFYTPPLLGSPASPRILGEGSLKLPCQSSGSPI